MLWRALMASKKGVELAMFLDLKLGWERGEVVLMVRVYMEVGNADDVGGESVVAVAARNGF